MNYEIVIRALSAEDGGGYLGYVPDLQGCMSDGETPEEAVSNTREAIDEWMEIQERLGRPVPAPGSARERAAKDRATLVDTIHLLSTDIENRVSDLEGQLRDLVGRIDALEVIWVPAAAKAA